MTETIDTSVDTEATDTDDALESSIALLPPAQPVDMTAIVTLREHVGAMREAKFFAEGMCYTQMVPDRFRGKPGDGAAAILYGAELGLSPIASLRSVIVVNGSPGLEARTMKALLMARGYQFKTIEKTNTVHEIHGWYPGSDPRVDEPDEMSRWTIEDCIQEGWVPQPSSPDSLKRPDFKEDWVTVNKGGKVSVVGNMKYITSPRIMLKAKATAELCRDLAPQILLGMPYSTDELAEFNDYEEERWRRDPDEPTRQAPRRGRGVGGLRARAAAAQQPADEPVDAEVVEPEATDVTQQEARSGDGDTEDAATDVENTTAATRPGAEGSDLNKAARDRLNGAIFATFGELKMNGDDQRDDRLIVIREIIGRQIESSKDLTLDELQTLRNSMISRKQAGTLEADVNDWLNMEAYRQAAAEDNAAEASPPNDGYTSGADAERTES